MKTWLDYANDPHSRKIYLAEIEACRRTDEGVETTVLRLATESFVDDEDVFWEPRLRGVPRFSRSAREVWRGQTQVGYGSLEIINSDGGLDDLLIGWNLSGRAVRVRLGFEGLPSADFRTVFAGRLGFPTLTDNLVSLSVSDDLTLLLRSCPLAGTRNGYLPELVSQILAEVGITSVDENLWSAWSFDYAFPARLTISDGTDAASALESLLAGLPVWWGMSRSGAFQIGAISPAPADAEPAFAFADDLEILTFTASVKDWLYRKMALTCFTDAEGTSTTAVQVADDTLSVVYPLAREASAVQTCLTSPSDAATVLGRRQALFGAPRRIIAVTAKVQPLALDLGQVVALRRERYGLSGNYRVVGLDEDHTANKVKMELLA